MLSIVLSLSIIKSYVITVILSLKRCYAVSNLFASVKNIKSDDT